MKYRIEYVFVASAVAFLFGKYPALSVLPGSTAQKPERLFDEHGLLWIVALVAVIFGVFTFVNVPMLEPVTSQQYVQLK